MIFYATKQTVDRYKLTMPEDIDDPTTKNKVTGILKQEAGDPMLEWGMKLFYFNRRKCLQVIHFASRMAFFVVGIRVNELRSVAHYISIYIHDLFADDAEILDLIDRWLTEHPTIVFDRLKDRSMIAQLNFTQRDFLYDGYKLYDYIEDGVLQTRTINYDYNHTYIPGGKTPDGKHDIRFGAERFRDALTAYYKNV